MDHEWGRTITEQGLGDLGATIGSAVHGTFGAYLINSTMAEAGRCIIMHNPTDTSVVVTLAEVSKVPGHVHFPYGYGVDPDAPV